MLREFGLPVPLNMNEDFSTRGGTTQKEIDFLSESPGRRGQLGSGLRDDAAMAEDVRQMQQRI